MIQIWSEYYSKQNPRFRVYKIREKQIQQYYAQENLKNCIKSSRDYPRYEHIFLLDENRFSFFRFDIFENYTQEVSIDDLQNIIKDKQSFIEQENKWNISFVSSYIEDIFVDWEKRNFVIGEKWEIFFRIYFIYIESITLNTFCSQYYNALECKNLTILPQSFHTILFLRRTLSRENFLLLYITEWFVKAIKVENGFYSSVERLNLGLNSLKQMYKDNGISQYRYKSYEEIEDNPFARDLIINTLEFYSSLLCKWLEEKWHKSNDIFVISHIVNNTHFMEIFNKQYKKLTNNYIIPFHSSDKLKTFQRKREPDGMDTLIYLNNEKKDYFQKE